MLLAEIIKRVHEGVSISEKLIPKWTTPGRMSVKPLPSKNQGVENLECQPALAWLTEIIDS